MLETERLLLRPWQPADLDPIAALNADPETMRYFPAPLDRAATAAALERYEQRRRDHGFSFMAAELKSSGEVIGMIGIGRLEMDADFCPCVEVGWRLARPHWGRGYAPEGARAWLRYAFEEVGVARVVAQTAIQNAPSRRVMEKIGMQPERCFRHPQLVGCPRLERSVLYVTEAWGELGKTAVSS